MSSFLLILAVIIINHLNLSVMESFFEQDYNIVFLIIITIIVYLIYRPLYLWYNKIQRRVELLESIDKNLKALKNHFVGADEADEESNNA